MATVQFDESATPTRCSSYGSTHSLVNEEVDTRPRQASFPFLLPTVEWSTRDRSMTEASGPANEGVDTWRIAVSTKENLMDCFIIIANSLNALFGIAIFAIPWGFEESGALGGTAVTALIAFLSHETARLLLQSQRLFFENNREIKGYPEMTASTLGESWYYVVQLATIISCLGGCTGYLIFLAQTIGLVYGLPGETALYMVTVPLILLSWIRTFQDLAIVNFLGVIALFIAVAIVVYDGSIFGTADAALEAAEIAPLPLLKLDTIFNYVGPATFMFTIHYVVLAIGAECLTLKPYLVLDFHRSGWSIFLCLNLSIGFAFLTSFIVIVGFGVVGFMVYRNAPFVRSNSGAIIEGCEDRVCQNVILNLAPGPARNFVAISMGFVVLIGYVILLAPAREHIESYFIRPLKKQPEWINDAARNLLRTILVLFNVYWAIKAPFFGSILGSIGGFTDALQCFVLPPLIYMQVADTEDFTPFQRVYFRCICAWGLLVMGYTVVSLFF